MNQTAVMSAADARSGKTHKDENFPVAGLIAPRHRAIVIAFYDFVRTGDDIADHADLAPATKVAMLDGLGAALTGDGPDDPVAAPLRVMLAERNLPPRHALDLLNAFRLDATKTRYTDFNDLMEYCALSAMPVGRFVLDVHGESQKTWPASDALCAALQIINHLQDCGKDFHTLDRVYLPADIMAQHGAAIPMLGGKQSPPPLRGTLVDLAQRTQGLLKQSAIFPGQVRDLRLALEVGAIQALAETLTTGLLTRDPLRDDVHASKAGALMTALGGALRTLIQRPFTTRAA